ncbi:MAG: HlyD family efflux transporter periplasmic adaptor subunit [Pseudomonadota bacterium]
MQAAKSNPLPELKIADTSAQDVQVAPKKPILRWVVLGGGALALIALLWVALPAVQRWAGSSVSVPLDRLRIATVGRGNLVRDVSVQGQVVAAVSPTVFAPADGTITLLTEAGASVEKDQALARIDSPELTNRLQQEQANLQRLDVALRRQRIESRQKSLDNQRVVDLAAVTLEAADREKRRADEGYKINSISAIDFEKAQDDLRNAELSHTHAVANAELDEERLAFELQTRELELEGQKLLVDDLARQVDELSLLSPVTGVVGNLLVEQKAAVARNVGVLTVVDLTVFEVEAQVPESYADDLGIGMAAEILVGNQTWPAAVVAVSPEIIQNQVTTRLRFAGDRSPSVRQNQRLTTRILLEERPDVLTLSRGQFLDSGGGRVAYVLGDDYVARRRSIEVGARSLSEVEVLAGLKPGERVVVSSIDQFRGAESVLVTQ